MARVNADPHKRLFNEKCTHESRHDRPFKLPRRSSRT